MSGIQMNKLGKSNLLVSNIAIGTSTLSGLHGITDENEAADALRYALHNGINFIDTAPFYNERRGESLLGNILTEFDREKLRISTKVGRYMNVKEQLERFDYSAEMVTSSVKESVKCLKVSYIDIIFIHDVEFASDFKQIKEETIPALVELKKQGLVKSIGVSGYSTAHLRHVVQHCSSDVDVIMSYFRHNLFDTSLIKDLSFYEQLNIGVINASPLGTGLLANDNTRSIPSWNPAHEEVKAACTKARLYCKENGINLEKLALRYSVETPGIACTLWSSRRLSHVKSNLQLSSTALTVRERLALNYLREKIFSQVRDHHFEAKLQNYHPYWSIQ